MPKEKNTIMNAFDYFFEKTSALEKPFLTGKEEKLIEKEVETEKESITLTNIFPTLKSILKLFSIFLCTSTSKHKNAIFEEARYPPNLN